MLVKFCVCTIVALHSWRINEPGRCGSNSPAASTLAATERRRSAQNLAVARTLSLVDRSSPYSQSKNQSEFLETVAKTRSATAEFQVLASTDRQKSIAALLAGKPAGVYRQPLQSQYSKRTRFAEAGDRSFR